MVKIKSKKVKLKEYNQYELRFLQVLVPKSLYANLLHYNYNLRIERYLWHGDKLIIGHPDDKLTFIKTRKPRPDLLDDYHDAFKHAAKLLKKHDILKGKVIWSGGVQPIPKERMVQASLESLKEREVNKDD